VSAYWTQIQEAAAYIRARTDFQPEIGLILGTGLGDLGHRIETACVIPFGDVPHFMDSTAESHAGQLILGTLGGRRVMAMQGRIHFYEGYTMRQVALPVRVMKALGCSALLMSNAVGGMNPHLAPGDITVMTDHINLMGDNPLIGDNDDRLGPRFPDMSAPYTPELIDDALAVARHEDFVAHRGVYVAVTGPNLETRAEYRFLRGIGADVVGMSTVPEVIVAVHAGLRVLGISVITDMCLPDHLEVATVEKILGVARGAEPKLRALVTSAVRRAGEARG
jgi:purine-nucleoside phosphorylase